MAAVAGRKQRKDVDGHVQLNARVSPLHRDELAKWATELGVSRDAVVDAVLSHALAATPRADGHPVWWVDPADGDTSDHQLRLLAG